MAKTYKVKVNEECIGCGACVSICPETFEMKGDKAVVKKSEITELSCEKEAKEGCPVQAISISE